jgi:hypothetical protein
MLPLRDTGTLRPHADHLHRQHHATFVELAEDFALAQS